MIARLKKRSEFLRVARTQRKCVTPGLILQICHHLPKNMADRAEKTEKPTSHEIRIGFTVSRKVGGAVQRNRAKRRLRAIVEDLFPPYAMPGYDYVVIGRRGTLTRPFKALENDLRKALKQLDVYQETKPPFNNVNA